MDVHYHERAAAFLNATGRVLVPVPELARAVDIDPARLLMGLAEDPRFVVVRPPLFPDLTLLPATDRQAYSAALAAAGVHATPVVALSEPESGDAVPALLRRTVGRLLARDPAPELAIQADRLEQVMRAALSEEWRAGTGRSTTPLPGPRPAAPDPPRRRAAERRPPRYRGSRRG